MLNEICVADRIKIVAWDGTGLWLHQKRLEKRNFTWPAIKDGTIVLTAAQLAMLMEGRDLWRVARQSQKHQPLLVEMLLCCVLSSNAYNVVPMTSSNELCALSKE